MTVSDPTPTGTADELDAMQLTVWRELVAFWSAPSPDPALLFDSDYVRRQPSPWAVQAHVERLLGDGKAPATVWR